MGELILATGLTIAYNIVFPKKLALEQDIFWSQAASTTCSFMALKQSVTAFYIKASSSGHFSGTHETYLY